MNLKNYVDYYLSDDEDSEEFALWAFGEDYQFEYGFSNFLKRWNERHSEYLKLSGTDLLINTIPKMVDLWRKNKHIY